MQEPMTLRRRWGSGAGKVGVGPEDQVCLVHKPPSPHSVGPAHPRQMVLQKSGGLGFPVYDKALQVNLICKPAMHATVDV